MSSAIRTALIGMAAAGVLLPMAASAQFKNQGYLVDTQSNIVRAPLAGVCVRTSDWTPARAVAECAPDLDRIPLRGGPVSSRWSARTRRQGECDPDLDR